MKGEGALLVSHANSESFRSSTVLGSLEELSTEKRNHGIGVISPHKRRLIQTIKNNGRVLERMGQENSHLIFNGYN